MMISKVWSEELKIGDFAIDFFSCDSGNLESILVIYGVSLFTFCNG